MDKEQSGREVTFSGMNYSIDPETGEAMLSRVISKVRVDGGAVVHITSLYDMKVLLGAKSGAVAYVHLEEAAEEGERRLGMSALQSAIWQNQMRQIRRVGLGSVELPGGGRRVALDVPYASECEPVHIGDLLFRGSRGGRMASVGVFLDGFPVEKPPEDAISRLASTALASDKTHTFSCAIANEECGVRLIRVTSSDAWTFWHRVRRAVEEGAFWLTHGQYCARGYWLYACELHEDDSAEPRHPTMTSHIALSEEHALRRAREHVRRPFEPQVEKRHHPLPERAGR